MFSFKLNQVLFLLMFHGYDFQRRIEGGHPVTQGKPKNYVVYLLKAAMSPQNYNGWLCGGAIVSEFYIVTSAACVTDVKHLYAIAGLEKYVEDFNIYIDKCTNEIKKKIVYICTPKAYELVYTDPAKWSNIDIAVVKVESAFDFTGLHPAACSHQPGKIDINYDPKYQMAGVDAIVLGWGHDKLYREQKDFTDFNNNLMYTSTLIQDKEECKKAYEQFTGMTDVIDKYMICTDINGNLDDKGVAILKAQPTADGCTNVQKLNSRIPIDKKVDRLHGELSCENPDHPEEQVVLVENSRKDNIKLSNVSRNDSDQKSHNSSVINKMNETVLNSRRSNTRRNGICQNDHGGPLVTWVGAHEMLIGVASAFKLTENRECIGPYLYTSTQCNGLFLDCILKEEPASVRRQICSNLLNEQGLKLVETHISWKNHPDGPAENERNGTTRVSAVNDTNSVSKNDTKTTPKVPPAENEENGSTPVSAVNDTNSVSKSDTKTTPKVPPAENEENGTTPVSAGNDSNRVSKSDTTTTPKVPPAENEENGTTPVSAVNDTNSVSKNDTKTTPRVTPAENENIGTTPVSAVNDTNSVSKNDTKMTPKVPPAENENNGTTPVSAVNDTYIVSKNDTKTTPKAP